MESARICPKSTRDVIDVILLFVEELAEKKLYTYQSLYCQRIVESTLLNDGDSITGLFSRQSGKSTTVALLISGMAIILPALAKEFPDDQRFTSFQWGFWVGVYAPIKEQAQIVFGKVRDCLSSERGAAILADPEINVRVITDRADTLTLSNGSIIMARTASPDSNIEGKTWHLLVLEEAQKILRSKVEKDLLPMLSSCVVGSTAIAMQNGDLLPMEEVQRTKRRDIWAVTSGGDVVPAQVSEFIDSGLQPTIRVRLKSGRSVTGTREHPVMVYDRATRNLQWRKLEDLSLGDHVCVAKKIEAFGTGSVGGKDEAHFLGVMIGDGSYRENCVARLSNCDTEIWSLADSIAKSHALRVKEFASYTTKDGRSYRECTFTAGGRGQNWLVSTLRKLGMWGQTGKNKRLGLLSGLCKSELAEVIAGLYDTDGYVSAQGDRTGVIGLSQSNRSLLVEVQHVLQRFGVHGTIKHFYNKERVLRGRILRVTKSWRLTVSGKENIETFAREFSLRVAYKKEMLSAVVGLLAGHKSKRVAKYPGLIWEKVTQIKDAGKQQVWDVVVPEHHSFLGNGVVLHNTNGSTVIIGTAWESRGGFHHYIKQNLASHAAGGPRNHFEFPWNVVVDEKKRAFEKDKNEYHLKYEKYIKGVITKLGGTDSDEFKMNYCCLWLENHTIAISESVFRAAAIPDLEAGQRYTGVQVAGLDIGKVNDPSVLTVMLVDKERPIYNRFVLPEADEDKQIYYRKTVIDWMEMEGSFEGTTGQYQRLVEYLRGTAVKVLCIDNTGMGDPVFERIEAMIGGTITCIPFRFTAQSKSALYKYYLQEIHAGRIRYAAGPRTKDRYEFSKFTGENIDLDRLQKGGYVVCEAPEGGHDEYPDSAALAAWAEKSAEDFIVPDIIVSENPGVSGKVSKRVRHQREDEAVSSGSGMSLLEMGAIDVAGARASRYRRRW